MVRTLAGSKPTTGFCHPRYARSSTVPSTSVPILGADNSLPGFRYSCRYLRLKLRTSAMVATHTLYKSMIVLGYVVLVGGCACVTHERRHATLLSSLRPVAARALPWLCTSSPQACPRMCSPSPALHQGSPSSDLTPTPDAALPRKTELTTLPD